MHSTPHQLPTALARAHTSAPLPTPDPSDLAAALFAAHTPTERDLPARSQLGPRLHTPSPTPIPTPIPTPARPPIPTPESAPFAVLAVLGPDAEHPRADTPTPLRTRAASGATAVDVRPADAAAFARAPAMAPDVGPPTSASVVVMIVGLAMLAFSLTLAAGLLLR